MGWEVDKAQWDFCPTELELPNIFRASHLRSNKLGLDKVTDLLL